MQSHFRERDGVLVVECGKCAQTLAPVEPGDRLSVIVATERDHLAFSCKGEA